MNRAITTAVALCAACLTDPGAAEAQTEGIIKRPFYQHSSIGQFKVSEVVLLRESPADSPNTFIRHYDVTIVMESCLPIPPAPGKQAGLKIRVDRVVGMLESRRGVYNWFPVEKGARFVGAFNVKTPETAAQFLPWPGNESPEQAWSMCALFHRAISDKKAPLPGALRQVLSANKSQISDSLFHLIGSYDADLLNTKDLAPSVIAYLMDQKVPLERRLPVPGYLTQALKGAEEAGSSLALAVLKLTVEAMEKGDAAAARNVLQKFNNLYLSPGGKTRLKIPTLEKSLRMELLSITGTTQDERLLNVREWLSHPST